MAPCLGTAIGGRALPEDRTVSSASQRQGRCQLARRLLFCATFLKPEMLHVYRHISGLREFRPIVLTQKREGNWPVENLEVIRRSPWRFLGRGAEKRTGRPWQMSGGESGRAVSLIEQHGCAVLHVFFGNVAVHLLPLLRTSPVPVIVSFHGSDVAGSMVSDVKFNMSCQG